MPQLWLKFTDTDGTERRVEITSHTTIIGRHSDCDITIADGRLSREHLKIEIRGEDFYATDLGSSNGTTLNGRSLNGEARFTAGDELSVGGLPIRADGVTGSADDVTGKPKDDADPNTSADGSVDAVSAGGGPAVSAPAGAGASGIAAAASSGGSKTWLLLMPLLAIFLVVSAGGIIYLFARKKPPVIAKSDDEFQYSTRDDKDSGDDRKDSTKDKDKDKNSSPGSNNSASPDQDDTSGVNSTVADPDTPATPKPSGEAAKVEQNAAAFLRRIANNDNKAFLTGEQSSRVGARIKQINTSALAENINSAKKNAAQLKSLAESKNLKPQFLAVAAMAKLGGGRGDVLQAATSVIDVYDKLGTTIGSEFAEDALLMVAAYDQGVAGDYLKMRNMLQALATNDKEYSRSIRTIWYLQKSGKITQAEFDSAINFLAIGTITQNPKDFGVNAEALTF
ncbi:MAG: FHA domain-containing protein [Acidobacteriota bacterium]